jgi:transcriptional regulator with XRE-family HTH domain
MQPFGDRLRQLRKENRLTLKDLQGKVNIPYGLIGHYEKEVKNPSVENLIKLAKFFGVTTDYLLGLDVSDLKPKVGVCEKIKSLRMSKKYSLKDFAYFIDVSPKELESIENGHEPFIDTLEKIAVHLDMDLAEFVDDINENSDKSIELSKIKLFAHDEENREYMRKIMNAKEKGIAPQDIVIGEKI